MAEFDQAQAEAEGWRIIYVMNWGYYKIIKDGKANLFWTDAEARSFVARRANEGSQYHEDALSLVESTEGALDAPAPRWKDGGLI